MTKWAGSRVGVCGLLLLQSSAARLTGPVWPAGPQRVSAPTRTNNNRRLVVFKIRCAGCRAAGPATVPPLACGIGSVRHVPHSRCIMYDVMYRTQSASSWSPANQPPITIHSDPDLSHPRALPPSQSAVKQPQAAPASPAKPAQHPSRAEQCEEQSARATSNWAVTWLALSSLSLPRLSLTTLTLTWDLACLPLALVCMILSDLV